MYTLGLAAKAAGKSKATISRAIRAGRISAIRDADGSYTIDPAELHRVYPVTVPLNGAMKQTATPHGTGAAPSPETVALQRLTEEQAETIRDLRLRLDRAEVERREAQRQLTAVLTDQRRRPAASVPEAGFARAPWWRRWRQ